MNFDESDDWTQWDQTEAVRWESARRASRPGSNANAADVIPAAKRRQVAGRQKSPSGGVYVGYEVVWMVPRALLAQGAAPKPADAVVDKNGVRWTVLTADALRHGWTWRLGCVNLVLAVGLTDSVDVQRAALSYDAAGAAAKAWPPAGGTYLARGAAARMQLAEAEVADQRAVRGMVGKYTVTVAQTAALAGVTNEDRLAWSPAGKTLYLDVTGVRRAGLIDELLEIDAELRP